MSGRSEPYELDLFGLTDIGRKREENEDQFLIASLSKSAQTLHSSLDEAWLADRLDCGRAYLLVVADGLGGLTRGREASGTAVEVVAEQISHAASCYYMSEIEREHEFIDKLEAAMERAHEQVKERLGADGRSAATTITMLTLIWPRGYFVHAGDSRGYYLRKGRLLQFTRDQTMADYMVDAGRLTEEEASQGPLKHVLLSAVGGQELKPSVGLVDFEDGDVLLLCTDGLTGHVPDDRIREILETTGDAQSACRQLVDEALAAGGTDNITAIVARMSERD